MSIAQPEQVRHFLVSMKLAVASGRWQLVYRLGQLVAWLAKTCPDMFKTKLAKLLWLVDFGHFRRQRISITGLAYARLPFGPVPDHFQILLGSLEEMGVVQLVERIAGPYSGEVIVS